MEQILQDQDKKQKSNNFYIKQIKKLHKSIIVNTRWSL